MNYPLISEYIEAVKNAEDNFDALNHLRPVLDTNGEPIMTSGNFAVVFKMVNNLTGKFYAIKCFLKEQEGRVEAYRLISKELEYVSSTFLTPIKYLDKELFVDSQSSTNTEFPVLQMDWVEGETLDKYIRKHIDDKYELEKLAYQFSRLAMWLMPQHFAHGDLKPDNILVRNDGMLVLVDYDGMFVPAMQGQKARELGSPDFRHPLRTEDDFNEHIDDFSIVSILLSLKAISIQPDLLNKYCNSDRLLLSEKDYRDISQCTLLKELYPSTDSELNILLSLFTLALEKKNLSSVSFRLFDLARPKEVVKPIVYELANTKVTDEDLAEAWEDEFGVKYSKDRIRLLKGKGSLSSYTILQGTKVICDKAFSYCSYLKEITIPDSVTSIGDSVFRGCTSLVKITIPDSVTSIGNLAFAGCKSLKEITIPDSVTSIGNNVFWGCTSLVKITIPDSVTSIGDGAFRGCNSLEEIIIPDSVTSIGDKAFFNCESLEVITIPDSVTRVGKGAFLGCESLKEITIPNSVTNIGIWAFKGCRSLEEITIPNSITSIGNGAFYNCEYLKKITIPDSVTSIGYEAFWYCDSLEEIIIPDSVTSIGDKAFFNCESLKKITIPDSVTSIGDGAFSDCYSLTEIKIPYGTRAKFEKMLPDCKDKLMEEANSIVLEPVNTKVTDEDLAEAWRDGRGVMYSKDKTRLLRSTNSLISASYIVLPETKVICDDAFAWSFMETITIPNSVTHIGNRAFEHCRLMEITIPDSVTSIGDNPFGNCRYLRNINCFSKHFIVHDDALYTADMKKIIAYIGKASSFTIPNSVTRIGNLAFYGCELSLLNIPESVTHIGHMTFLKDFLGPYSWKHIECHSKNFKLCDGALYTADMSKIISYFGNDKALTIPSSVNCIDDRAFYGTELESVIIPSSVTKIGEEAFYNCHAQIECLSKYYVIKDGELCTLDLKRKFTNNKEYREIISLVKSFELDPFTRYERTTQKWNGLGQGSSIKKILSYLKKLSL